MGDKPCPIIPKPKTLDLRPGTRPWPGALDVQCHTPHAEPVAERFRSPISPRPGAMSLVLDSPPTRTAAGSYQITFTEREIRCTAHAPDGFRYAFQTLRQLAADPDMPLGTIADQPSLAIRGFHLNFESYRRMDLAAALHLIETAARFKLNTILVEYGPRFPFTSSRDIVDADSLTPGQIASLTAAAEAHGIELIPLQQSLAHLEYLLKHDRFARLRERPPKTNLLCPTHPESMPLIKSLMSEVIALHPRSMYFHIGGDEARKIGECPRCAPLVQREGVGQLYGRCIGELARWILAQGRRPIVWDDTLCAHPDALAHLPKETIIQYWDYIAVADPTPVLIPRMAHASGGPRVAHDWYWSLPGRRRALSDVQRDVMDSYSKPARLKSALDRDARNEFGRYLGPGFPRRLRALPYLEYYQDKGFDVITSPTGMGNGDMADGDPNFRRFEANIATHAARCIENRRALGIITTAWYNMPPELLMQPLIWTAMKSW